MKDQGRANIGPGRYDAQLTGALNAVGANQGVLMVFDGRDGPSFCCQLDWLNGQILPGILRGMADRIEKANER